MKYFLFISRIHTDHTKRRRRSRWTVTGWSWESRTEIYISCQEALDGGCWRNSLLFSFNNQQLLLALKSFRWMNSISNGCCNNCSIIILHDTMSKSVVVLLFQVKKKNGVSFEIVFSLSGLTSGMGRAWKQPCRWWWALICACEQQDALLWYINITYFKTLNLIHLQNKPHRKISNSNISIMTSSKGEGLIYVYSPSIWTRRE